jgi:hypothetical protein
MDISKLEEIMFSGGDSRYIGPFGGGYAGLIGLVLMLKKGVIACEEREFPELPAPSDEEQEYIDNELRYGRSTHDPEIAKQMIRIIWHARSDLPICKSWEKYRKWLEEGKPFPLYYVMVEPWYPAGRADVGFVKGEKGEEYPQVIIAVEIGDTRVDKPIETFKGSTGELWIVPYPEWDKPCQTKYYIFRRGINWGNPYRITKEEALDVLDTFPFGEYMKRLVKAGIEQSLRE